MFDPTMGLEWKRPHTEYPASTESIQGKQLEQEQRVGEASRGARKQRTGKIGMPRKRVDAAHIRFEVADAQIAPARQLKPA